MDQLIDDYNETDQSCYFDFSPQGDFSSIESTISIAVYRFLQEAISNVIKHAQSDLALITLSLHSAPHELTIRVQDHGKGFDITKKTSSLGLISMRERMSSLGGNFSIESEQGKGTTIFARIPLKN